MGGAVIAPLGVSKNLLNQLGQCGVVLLEFLSSVDVVVVVVWRAVGVEPALYALGPILGLVVCGVFALPQSLGHCGHVGFG